MHGLLRNAFLLLVAGACAPATAASVFSQLQEARSRQVGGEPPGSAWVTRQMLAEPESPYSGLVARPTFTNDIYWGDVVQLNNGDEALALRRLASELGLTTAKPGSDVTAGPGFRDTFVSAQATKAGLDADIFWRVLDIYGYAHAPRFASHALGLQLLREQIATTNTARQAQVGIYPDVFLRVMHATHPDQVSKHDLRYLDTLVQHRLVHPMRDEGLRTTWRVARIAAAFRDARGYIGGAPCLPDASPNLRYAGTGGEGDERTPCLVAATDQAVHRWYIDELRKPQPVPDPPHSGLGRLGALVALLVPLLDVLAIAEVAEAAVADEMLAAEAIPTAEADAASERAFRLTCRIPE